MDANNSGKKLSDLKARDCWNYFSCRRTALTTLANKGVAVHIIREIAGHQNLATTQQYLDISSDKLQSAVELLR